MTKQLSLALVSSVLIAAPVFAASASSSGDALDKASREYISTKLACYNMSKFQKDICMRDADEAYRQAKAAAK